MSSNEYKLDYFGNFSVNSAGKDTRAWLKADLGFLELLEAMSYQSVELRVLREQVYQRAYSKLDLEEQTVNYIVYHICFISNTSIIYQQYQQGAISNSKQ